MIGYKALNEDFTAFNGYKYEIGKTYELPEDEKLEIYKSGFHFCKNPIDAYGYYQKNNNTIIVEVKALGDIVQDGTKYATNKIKIIREYSKIYNNHNTGMYNAGDYNSESLNTGYYNKETDISFTCFINSLDYSFQDLWDRIHNKKLIEGDREKIEALPNYDPKIFTEITGIKFDDDDKDDLDEEMKGRVISDLEFKVKYLSKEIDALNEIITKLKTKSN